MFETTQDWKVGDWVILDMSLGQIKELRDGGYATFSEGTFETFGMLARRFRPFTLTSKSIVETFKIFYDQLREINGEGGFNYPAIYRHFSDLALEAIDQPENVNAICMKVQHFVRDARDYTTTIQGVPLFRPR